VDGNGTAQCNVWGECCIDAMRPVFKLLSSILLLLQLSVTKSSHGACNPAQLSACPRPYKLGGLQQEKMSGNNGGRGTDDQISWNSNGVSMRMHLLATRLIQKNDNGRIPKSCIVGTAWHHHRSCFTIHHGAPAILWPPHDQLLSDGLQMHVPVTYSIALRLSWIKAVKRLLQMVLTVCN